MSPLHSHSFFQKGLHDTRGLIVTGTHARCGKTVACAGLVGVMSGLGFKVQAIKPMSFLPTVSLRKGCEQAYFDRLNPPLQPVDGFSVDSPYSVTKLDWQRLIEGCRKRVYPYLLETPGSLASLLRPPGTDSGGASRVGEPRSVEIIDCVTLAQTLEIPILLVTSKQPELIACLAPAFAYLQQRQAPLVAWLAVETAPIQAPTWDQDVLYLSHRYDVPYLGELAYSPSISVETLQQGNLLRTTEMGVDLLPIQQAWDVAIPL
jgi:hypothetical protein